jgi:hypothetical protein
MGASPESKAFYRFLQSRKRPLTEKESDFVIEGDPGTYGGNIAKEKGSRERFVRGEMTDKELEQLYKYEGESFNIGKDRLRHSRQYQQYRSRRTGSEERAAQAKAGILPAPPPPDETKAMLRAMSRAATERRLRGGSRMGGTRGVLSM